MPLSAVSLTVGSGMGVALTAVASAVAGRTIERRWRSREDPIGPLGLTPPTGERVVVRTDDGAQLAALVCDPPATSGPDGPTTVVLAHGWTGSRLVWAPVARRLVETGHRVVMYDQRGHGESTFGSSAAGGNDPTPGPLAVGAAPASFAEPTTAPTPAAAPSQAPIGTTAEMTVSRFGADVATVLEQLDVRDAVLAGHSMGGFSIMAFACDHPEVLRDRVRGLALVATAAHGLGAGSMTPFVTRVFGSRIPVRAVGRPRLGLLLLRNVVGREPCYSHVAATRDLFVATPPHVTAACFACFAHMDLRAPLAGVDLPSVVMVGECDNLTPVSLSEALVASLPDARFDLLPGAGHMLPLETPDQVAATIAELAAT